MLIKHGLAGLATVTSSSESAMASDTSALYWYAPDSVVESGGTITSWNDKTSNGNNLAQVASLTMPTYNAGGYVEFTGSTVIGDASFPFANSTRNAWGTGGTGEYAIFIVGLPDWSGQPGGTSVDYVYLSDGTATAFDSTTVVSVRCQNNTNINAGRLVGTHRVHTSTALTNALVPASQTSAARDALLTLHLSSIVMTQSAAAGEINDAEITGSGTAPADLAVSEDGLFIGGWCNGTTTLNNGWIGRIYEVFATGDASTTNVDAVRAELIAKYSIA